jgi:hypothetical protein
VSANVTNYMHGGLTAGVEYFYRIRASNSSGDSTYSSEASAVPFVLSSAAAAAVFVRADEATRGSWKNSYGSDGYQIIGNAASLPGYAQVTASGKLDYLWNSSTTAAQALEKIPGPDRIAACWYAPESFTVRINLLDGKPHHVALYFLDWDNTGRVQLVEMLDPASGAVLDSRTVSGFSAGRYFVWQLTGNVLIRMTRNAGNNAVLMGLFFDPAVQEEPSGGLSASTKLGGSLNANGRFKLRLEGEAGQTLVIEASSDLRNWVPLSTNTLKGVTLEFDDPDSGSLSSRFYRARLAD